MPSKRVIFFGTPEIGASVLHALLESGVEIVGVVTRQDKPMGRKHEISISAVKRLATESNIEIFQPASPKEIIKNIEELKPDLIVTCAYGCILPSSLLSIPTFGCINVHTSLLPR
jgi:methionyl-tRNA formyltransferase